MHDQLIAVTETDAVAVADSVVKLGTDQAVGIVDNAFLRRVRQEGGNRTGVDRSPIVPTRTHHHHSRSGTRADREYVAVGTDTIADRRTDQAGARTHQPGGGHACRVEEGQRALAAVKGRGARIPEIVSAGHQAQEAAPDAIAGIGTDQADVVGRRNHPEDASQFAAKSDGAGIGRGTTVRPVRAQDSDLTVAQALHTADADLVAVITADHAVAGGDIAG